MRPPFIAGNWKMYKTVFETVTYIKEFRQLTQDVTGVEIVLAVPFTAVHAAAEAARNSNVGIGAQDVHWEAQGAFTGEISAAMLAEAGAEYVIIGHSERRTLFGDTDETVSRKLHAALAARLTPIVCIGETRAEREASRTFDVLRTQVDGSLRGVTADQLPQLVVAYEPVWAIGTGRHATPEQAAEAHAFVRDRLRDGWGVEAANQCQVIYGGSVKPDNIGDLIGQPDVDGALVGGASLDVQQFSAVVSQSAGRTV
jgi:triosephosphate isomerase (TIM)